MAQRIGLHRQALFTNAEPAVHHDPHPSVYWTCRLSTESVDNFVKNLPSVAVQTRTVFQFEQSDEKTGAAKCSEINSLGQSARPCSVFAPGDQQGRGLWTVFRRNGL